jgi:hypothetical protein
VTTPTERAVLEAARRVFRADAMRERIERMATLQRAVGAYELELTASTVGKPDLEEQFLNALGFLDGQVNTRAWNAYKRNWASPAVLAAADELDVKAARQAGPAVVAAWTAALTHVGLQPAWFSIVDMDRAAGYLEEIRRGAA